MQRLGHLEKSGTAGIKLGKRRDQLVLQEAEDRASPGPLETSSNLGAELPLHSVAPQRVEAHGPCADAPEKMGVLTPNSLCVFGRG